MEVGINAAAVSASFWEKGGYVASVFVTAGVALEFWEIFQAIRAGKVREKAIELIALVILIIGLIGEIWTAVEANKYNGLEIAGLQLKANAAINDAVINKNRLLEAWRESARDHLALQQMEKAVFPREIEPNQFAALTTGLKGLGPVNIAYADTYESSQLAMQFEMLFGKAGITGKVYLIPVDQQFHGMPIFATGVQMYAVNLDGRKVAQTLSSDTDFDEGWGNIPTIPLLEAGVPLKQNCLIIGENDAAFQPWPGQPGEGLDQYGLPVPAP